MPLETGGRSDKQGNKYEIQCIIYEILKVFKEINYSIMIEPLGKDEIGTDILITDFKGRKEHQQCKARNASKEYWSIADLNSRHILDNWKRQLEREDSRSVALVSAVGCSFIVDLHNRAINSDNNPDNFLKYQIGKSSKTFQDSYYEFCKIMDLDITKSVDVIKSIEFLKRIDFKQMSEYTLKENIFRDIEYYFVTDEKMVYDVLTSLVVNTDIYGKEITEKFLEKYFENHDIQVRMLDRDKRIFSQIKIINEEYRNSFKPLKEGMIYRNEFQKCIEMINNEQSFIISGNAGTGKSVCTEAILSYCEDENIPYIALKLDRKIPHKNSTNWGKELGFPGSIVHVLDMVSKNKVSILILDQLDALRWTQTNSSESLSVCMEIIREIRNLNKERKKKIVTVFVCREYDLRNDNNIKSLFENQNDDSMSKVWAKIIIKNFDQNVVREIVGERYERLTAKTKQLLQIPSNLYVWEHLDEKESCNDCTTSNHLIEEWFQQICRNSANVGIEEGNLKNAIKEIAERLDKKGCLYVSKRILNVAEREIDYLVSIELLIKDGQKIGFVHQSILDYFIANKMMTQFFDGEKIEEIIGEKNKQTPIKRYQVQMFLQSLYEFDSKDFLLVGIQILDSSEIRFYVKYVFLEVLGQITNPDKNISEYIRNECKQKDKYEYFVNNVICGNATYITILRESGILEQWFLNDKKKNIVFMLFQSISPNLSIEDIAFIKQHAFLNKEDDNRFRGYFLYDITQDSDALFELRMLFYDKYPIWLEDLYIDIEAMINQCESRIIRIITLLLKNKITSSGNYIYKQEEYLVDQAKSCVIQNGEFIVDELLQYIPKKSIMEISHSGWSNKNLNQTTLERVVVELLKKANIIIINKNPEFFWEYYGPYMGKNYAIFNELILHGMQYLPQSYSNCIIKYLAEDIDKRMFEYTSGNKNELELSKSIIRKHILYCSKECLQMFCEKVAKYISPESISWYKSRIETNKQKRYDPVYWSFWGDFQYEILQCIPQNQLESKYKDLLNVLYRKFEGKTSRYSNLNDHSGWVKSPVAGKKLGKKQWLQIITNNKISSQRYAKWQEVPGGFIESSVDMYVNDFENVVKDDPVEWIKIIIKNKNNIIPEYIEAMYSGVEYSSNFKKVDQHLLEQMFKEFPCDMKSQRALYFCGIIEKAEIYSWSKVVIERLKELAICYEENLEQDSNSLNCKELRSYSLNFGKGRIIKAIEHLLWKNKELLDEFKTVIDKLISDNNLLVRMASLNVLWPIYFNINKEWAETRILEIYESDIRMIVFPHSRNMLFRLSKRYKERVFTIIRKSFMMEGDKTLAEISGYTVCEFYIRCNEFEDLIFGVKETEQLKAILYMAIEYLEYNEFREISKNIILQYKNTDYDIELLLGRMFNDRRVDIEKDSKFLIEIMKAKVGKRLVYSFIFFLEEKSCSVKPYAEVIIALCENILYMSHEELIGSFGLDRNIAKLIIALYDETYNSYKDSDCKIAEKCLDLWDIMFEKQIGQVRELSRELMER